MTACGLFLAKNKICKPFNTYETIRYDGYTDVWQRYIQHGTHNTACRCTVDRMCEFTALFDDLFNRDSVYVMYYVQLLKVKNESVYYV